MSWWRADLSAEDAIGTNHGVARGTQYTLGVSGHAFSLDGDDRVDVADSVSLQLTPSLSIEGWIKIHAWPFQNSFGAAMVIMRADDRPGLDPYYIAITDSGLMRFAIHSDNAPLFLDTPVETNRFIHFAATLDDATGLMRLYLDGVIARETNTTLRPVGDLGAFGSAVGIGNAPPGSTFAFGLNGQIDELKLYSRALSMAEVQMLYANPAPCTAAIDIQLIAGLTVSGPVGRNVRIDFRDALTQNSPWQPLTNFTIPSTPFFFLDTNSVSTERRIYRAVFPQ